MKKINNFFTNKFLIIVLMFIAILFSFTSSCFATVDEEYYIPYSITYTDNTTLSFYLPRELYNKDYFLIYSRLGSVSYDPSTPQYRFVVISSDVELKLHFENGSYYVTDINGNYPSYVKSNDITNVSTFNNRPTIYNTSDFSESQVLVRNDYTISECNFTFKDDNGDVVFQQAPAQEEQQQGGTTQGTALTLEQVEEIPQAMTQTLRVLIPVAMIIFSVGLVVFLVRWVILRLM